MRSGAIRSKHEAPVWVDSELHVQSYRSILLACEMGGVHALGSDRKERGSNRRQSGFSPGSFGAESQLQTGATRSMPRLPPATSTKSTRMTPYTPGDHTKRTDSSLHLSC